MVLCYLSCSPIQVHLVVEVVVEVPSGLVADSAFDFQVRDALLFQLLLEETVLRVEFEVAHVEVAIVAFHLFLPGPCCAQRVTAREMAPNRSLVLPTLSGSHSAETRATVFSSSLRRMMTASIFAMMLLLLSDA